MSIMGTVGYIIYEVIKRRSNKIIYKQENESIFRMLEYPIVFMLIFFGMMVPSFTYAAFSSLFGKQEYVVADKKNRNKK